MSKKLKANKRRIDNASTEVVLTELKVKASDQKISRLKNKIAKLEAEQVIAKKERAELLIK